MAKEPGQSQEKPEPVGRKSLSRPQRSSRTPLSFTALVGKAGGLCSKKHVSPLAAQKLFSISNRCPNSDRSPGRQLGNLHNLCETQSLGLQGGFFHRFSFCASTESQPCCFPASAEVCFRATSPAALLTCGLSPPAAFSPILLLPSLLLPRGSQQPSSARRLLLGRLRARRSAAGRTLRGRICMFTAQRIKGPCSYHCRTEYYKSSLRIPNPRAAWPLFGNIKKLGDRNNQFPNDTLSNKTFLILSLPSPFSLPLPQLDNLT